MRRISQKDFKISVNQRIQRDISLYLVISHFFFTKLFLLKIEWQTTNSPLTNEAIQDKVPSCFYRKILFSDLKIIKENKVRTTIETLTDDLK